MVSGHKIMRNLHFSAESCLNCVIYVLYSCSEFAPQNNERSATVRQGDGQWLVRQGKESHTIADSTLKG